jgi:CheY-like chemotaxis protein
LNLSEREAIAALAEIVEAEKDRITRLWSRRLVAQSEVEIPTRYLREPLSGLVYELARLLRERGEDALRLWPESIRGHGVRRFDDRYDAGDVARELTALQVILIEVYASRHGVLEPQVAEAVATLAGEACASVLSSFTRLLRTEEVRFREAALMESVLHHVDVGILVAERDGTISFVTPPVERLIGVPARSLVGALAQQRLGSVLAQRNARRPDGTPFRVSDLPLLRALKEQAPVRCQAVRLSRPDGAERVVEMSATPLFDEAAEGQLVGVIQTLVDRTESEAFSRELAQAYRELHQGLAGLLPRTRARALGQLAAVTAHALGNYLNVVRLRLMRLRKEVRTEDLDALERAASNLGELSGRLQALSTVSTAAEPLSLELEVAVRQAAAAVRPQLETREHPVQVAVAPLRPVQVQADPVFLGEALVALLLEAARRMPGGGTVEVDLVRQGAQVQVQVADHGPVASAEELATVFDPLKGRHEQPEHALMLGVARSEVQRWGGDLVVEPRASGGPGVTFILRLPVVETAAPRVEHGAAGESARRKPDRQRRVLVVDDDPDNAWMIAQVLGDEGYQAQVAHSGAVARELWGSQHFDAALLDVMLPDASGWELAREFRQRAPQARLAVVTGTDVRGQSRATLALVDAVFGKPVDVDALDEFLSSEEQGGMPPGQE